MSDSNQTADHETGSTSGSETETETETTDSPGVTIDVEGRSAVEEVIQKEEREQKVEQAQGESKRRRLLAAKRKREQEAEPFDMTFNEADASTDATLDPLFVGETFQFKPFPKELKNAFQEASLKFAGVDEDDDLVGEPAKQIDEMNQRIIDALAHYSTDPELDLEFWTEMTDMEDRQIMAGQLIAEQGK